MATDVPDIEILHKGGSWCWIKDAHIRRAAVLACDMAAAGKRADWQNSADGVDAAIVLGDDDLLHRLNRRFRGRDEPTDILSFPAQCFAGKRYQLGDVALSEESVLRVAQSRAKEKSDHLLHLVVHGVLHLWGHAHKLPGEARLMESLETRTLAKMSISNPYTRPSSP